MLIQPELLKLNQRRNIRLGQLIEVSLEEGES